MSWLFALTAPGEKCPDSTFRDCGYFKQVTPTVPSPVTRRANSHQMPRKTIIGSPPCILLRDSIPIARQSNPKSHLKCSGLGLIRRLIRGFQNRTRVSTSDTLLSTMLEYHDSITSTLIKPDRRSGAHSRVERLVFRQQSRPSQFLGASACGTTHHMSKRRVLAQRSQGGD
jgi:hypothetical protein